MQSWMIGLVSGLVFAGYWPALPAWPLFALVAAPAVFLRPWRSPLKAFLFGLACGCALGLAHGKVLLQSRIVDDCVGAPITVTGTVTSLPRISSMPGGGHRQWFEFFVDQLSPSRCSGPEKLLLSYYGDDSIQAGDLWQFEVKLKKPWGLANPGGYNMQGWFAQKAIDAVGSVRGAGANQKLSSRPGLFAVPTRLRQHISTHIEGLALAPEVTAILRAITVADGSGIDPSLWFLFQQFGLNHLLVISGLHVGMVAGLGYLLGGLVLRLFAPIALSGAWIPGICALFLAGFYGALAGFSLPVQRALCMLCCFVIAGVAGRKSGSANNLLLAAAGFLTLNPLAAIGSGFWLSFGAVGALLWFARWQRGLGSVTRLLQTQIYMSMLMLPLGALFFGGGSLAAVLANLLMIPLLGMVVVPTALLAVVCYWCGWGAEAALWQVAGWPLGKLLPFADHLADTSGGWLYVPLTVGLREVVPGLVAVALLVLPGRNLLKPLAIVLMLPLLLPLDHTTTMPANITKITVLDVGQGTAVVVRSGDRVLLYDTGGGDPYGVNMGSLAIIPYLREEGIRALDTLIISHADLDHSAGLRVVRDAMPIARFRFGGAETDFKQIEGQGRPCVAGEAWRWPGGQVFQFMSPALETLSRRNDNSCVLQIEVGEYRVLLVGDVEKDRERMLVQYWGDQLHSNWLLAAHHGSKTSTTGTFLKRVQPELAIISSGYANRFRHPHASVVERLSRHGVKILSTANSGALEFGFAPSEPMQVTAYREAERRYWK